MSVPGKQSIKSRKDLRKEKRLLKKQKKVDYFARKKAQTFNSNSNKQHEPGRFVRLQKKEQEPITKKNCSVEVTNGKPQRNIDEDHERDRKKLLKLENEMKKQRIIALNEENEMEDKAIKQLEKKLKLNKRKSKKIPQSFIDCGLDYILDVCDSEKLKSAVSAEMNLKDSDSEYEEDLALITGKENMKIKDVDYSEESDIDPSDDADDAYDEDLSDADEDPSGADEDFSDADDLSSENDITFQKKQVRFNLSSEKNKNASNKFKNETKNLTKKFNEPGESGKKRKNNCENTVEPKKSKLTEENSEHEEEEEEVEEEEEIKEDSTYWEDIYGRTRDKAGNIVEVPKEKYVPPHLRETSSENSQRKQELEKIKKQLKGLLNRLAENNMHSISNQVDELYMKNSRNDMNETMFNLFYDSLITAVHTPERLIMEHAMLIAILQANVGTEIGAFFLQNLVNKFDELHSQPQEIENKKIDNLLLLLCHFYTFKVYNCELLYDILGRFCDSFKPKDIDLILVILRSVGFSLRKDDAIALKKLILRVQKLANEATDMKDDARVKFMLDVLLGIKNNNISKIPGYDPSHAEHLKKIIKAMFRKGNYVTELKISLDDLLKADKRGRWWIVGSAWSGPAPNTSENNTDEVIRSLPSYSQEILELAKHQRMNTSNRKNIFCILMTAEDYLDAFEKLLKLGLRGQPEQEVVHVLIHCLLNEQDYNPYYSLIAEQLCISDRRHQMTIQFAVWDRFKELKSMRKKQITNLAKFLAHLFLQKSMPISVLKVVEFVELDKPGVRLIRQVLMSILLIEDKECMIEVFDRISKPSKLAPLRQSLALFLHHFILRKTSSDTETSPEEKLLQERVDIVIKILNCERL